MTLIQQWLRRLIVVVSNLDTNTGYSCYNCKDTGSIQSDGMELSSMYEPCPNCK